MTWHKLKGEAQDRNILHVHLIICPYSSAYLAQTCS
jgi:hypothetical protein